jgi:hypothetical protein
MKFLVISDTHGRIEEAVEVYRSLDKVDRILHLGDFRKDGLRLESCLGIPVTALKGNADGGYSQEDYRILNTEYGTIYLSHGHMEAVKRGPENILYKASSLGCKAVLHGHTHVPAFLDFGGIYLLNPGSLTQPAGGRSGSYAVLETSESEFNASIFYYHPGEDSEPVSKVGKSAENEGFLRRILNDSDRF